MRGRVRIFIVVCGALLVVSPLLAGAQIRPAEVVSGLAVPLGLVQDPADPRVQFVVEQSGRIRVVQDGVLRATPFIDLSSSVAYGGELGLLGLAFAPDPSSDRFYVNYTNTAGDTVVARFKRSAANRLVADPSSRLDFLWSTGERVIRQPFQNHNGGNLAFGPDGYLYIGMGDGGSGGDPGNRAQDGRTLLGKMLRIDVSVPDGDTRGFRVPPDNPFLQGVPVAALPETWAFGFRNPWRFSFDNPALGGTGALIIGDVGQGEYEEIDYEPRGRGGRNYGWRVREGAHPYLASAPAYTPLTDPIFDYDHRTGFAVISGYVYRGRALGAAYSNRYFYADLNGRVWSLGLDVDPGTGEARVTDRIEHTTELGGAAYLGNITSFGEDASGELYLVTQSGGRVIKLVPPDSDGDALPDWWELQFGLNPASAAGDEGANGDPDGDRRSNLEEFQSGSHPRGFIRQTVSPAPASTNPGASIVLFNPSGTANANVVLYYRALSGGETATGYVRLSPKAAATFPVIERQGGASGRFLSLVAIESDLSVLAALGTRETPACPGVPTGSKVKCRQTPDGFGLLAPPGFQR